MTNFSQRYQCINECLPFEAFGTPSVCPYCAVNEVYPLSEEATVYEQPEEYYENANASSGTE